MQNIIEIEEKNNRLSLIKQYEPIVSGTTNYYIKFTFSEDWKNCVSKTAYFVVEGKKIPVLFEGDVCNVPAMPYCSAVKLFLVASSKPDQIMTTAPIKLILERNPSMDKLTMTEPFKSYYAALLGVINKVESGDIKVADVEYAKVSGVSNSQVSKTGDEDVQGVKNFLDGILTSGQPVACQGEISNPNLLINGDFRVNQRKGTVYSTVGKYTVDRWKLVSGSVEAVSGGIILNGTIEQKFEKEPMGELTASADQTNGEVVASYENGVFTLSAENVLIGWAKLETGTVATRFSPKTPAIELADCKRYYQRIRISGEFIYINSTISIIIPCTEMRIIPTLTMNTLNGHDNIRGAAQYIDRSGWTVSGASVDWQDGSQISLLFKTNLNLTLGQLYNTSWYNAGHELDAEIY